MEIENDILGILTPFHIDCKLFQLGSTGLSFILGNYLHEIDRCLFRGSYNEDSLMYSSWTTPKALSFCYYPDKYSYLLTGESSCEYKSSFGIQVKSSPTIHVTGGYSEYLSRLTSKKRSHLKSLDSESLYGVVERVAENEIASILYDEYSLQESQMKSETNPDLWFDNFSTHQSPCLLALSVLYGRKCLDCTYSSSVLIVSIYENGELICHTPCIATHDKKVLHGLMDCSKSDNYSCKSATLALIKYAASNGYDYVDIGNVTILETERDEDWAKRLSYKNAFYVREDVYIPRFFDSENTYTSYLERLNENQTKSPSWKHLF